MEKMQKFTVSENGRENVLYVVKDKSEKTSPIFCPVCTFAMKSAEDFDSFRGAECCMACNMEFVQLNRKEWKGGWRPSSDQIKDYIDKNEKRRINLFHSEEDS